MSYVVSGVVVHVVYLLYEELTVIVHEDLWSVCETTSRVYGRSTVSVLSRELHVDDWFDVQPRKKWSIMKTVVVYQK